MIRPVRSPAPVRPGERQRRSRRHAATNRTAPVKLL